jgi:hypothetical protein
LIVNFKLIPLQGVPERGFHFDLITGDHRHIMAIKLAVATFLAFSPVQGRISLSQ